MLLFPKYFSIENYLPCNWKVLSQQIVYKTTFSDKNLLLSKLLRIFTLKRKSYMKKYTIEELNARIDEAEEGIEKGEGKSFEEMMNGFRRELLWLK